MMRPSFTRLSPAYSLIEMVVSMAIVCALAAGAFRLIDIAHRTAETGEEAADMLQRLRTVSVTMEEQLLRAGAGAPNTVSDALSQHVPAVRPGRAGDPAGTFRNDTITVIYARSGAAQASIAGALTSVSNAFTVVQAPGCPLTQAACGLKTGDTVIVFDRLGHFDAFGITDVSGSEGAMTPLLAPGSSINTYDAGSSIVAVEERTYALKLDASGRPYQLVSYSNGSAMAIPVAEHVVRLTFDYFDDPSSLTPMNSADAAANPLGIRAVAVNLRVEAGSDALRAAAGTLFSRPGTATDVTRALPDIEMRLHVSLRNSRGAG